MIKHYLVLLIIMHVYISFSDTLYSKKITIDREDIDFCTRDTLTYRILIEEKSNFDLNILSHFAYLTEKKGISLPSIYKDQESRNIGVYKIEHKTDSIKEIVINFFPLVSDSLFRATRLKRWNDSLSGMSFHEYMDFILKKQDSVTVENELPYLGGGIYYLMVNISIGKSYKTRSKVRDEIFFIDSIEIKCP